MGAYPESGWEPTFRDPFPLRWVVLVQTKTGIDWIADSEETLTHRDWMVGWLARHEPREPREPASYLQFRLADDWHLSAPSGRIAADGVRFVGWGLYAFEPPRAIRSRIGKIVSLAGSGG